MILFLQNDINKKRPVGYEVERSNFFDPLEDPDIEQEGKNEPNDDTSGSSSESNEENDNESSDASSTGSSSPINCSSDRESTEGHTSSVRYDSSTVGGSESLAADAQDAGGNTTMSAHESSEETSEIDSSDEEENDAGAVKKASPLQCARPLCRRKSRHDSIFCSDACGVTVLELDLLHSLQYSEDMHPSQLR